MSKRKLSESNDTVENEDPNSEIMDTNEVMEDGTEECSSTANFKIYFKVSGLKDKIGVCLLCKKKNIEKIIKMKCANTGLKRHLERYHRDIYDSIFSKDKVAPNQKN